MGLYLAVFDDDDEVDGVEVGSYEDFGIFRDIVTKELEHGQAASRFPTLQNHSDCDGLWTVEDAPKLRRELQAIREELQKLPPREFSSDWQRELERTLGLNPSNLAESFIDVDGEPLIERLISLTETAEVRRQPIIFQ